MMRQIGELFDKSRVEEPAEVRVIKDFVYEKFQVIPQITIQQTQIIIGVPSAALAGALRMHLHQLQQLCQTEKRLAIRIGS
jgi:hypothetical protein